MAGVIEVSWRDINKLIAECKALRDPDERLRCLHELHQQTGDAMVAFNIGKECEVRGDYQDAARWYRTACAGFPMQKWKQEALAALERVEARLERSETATQGSAAGRELEGLDPSSTVLIVACTKKKIWQTDHNAPPYVPARYAYRGDDFMAFTRWLEEIRAESRGFRWLILSAKYGYIEPWHPINDYDVTFADPQTGPISDDALYSQVMFQTRWHDRKPLRDFRNVLYSGSTTYGEKIRKSFRDLPAEVRELQL